jgi:hypothetical protein
LTIAKLAFNRPPERSTTGINPLTIAKLAFNRPPERSTTGLDPLTTAKLAFNKPPERSTTGLDPLTTAKLAFNRPPERSTTDINPLTTSKLAFNKPPERSGIDNDPTIISRKVNVKPPERGREFIDPHQIGQAGNAFGFAYTRNTFLWADDNLNTITFVHRMINPPGTGYLAYDISKDGGETWTNNIQVYDPTLSNAYNARYPQGGIYNPAGNTNPDNAYFHYFAPTLDGSNSGGATNWGGYAYGVMNLGEGATPTQTNRPSVPPYYQCLPAAFTITQTGEAWMVDESTQGNSGGYTYNGELIIGHGIWDNSVSDFIYTYDRMALEIDPDDFFNDWKIAFSPDGQVGWILCLTNLVENLPYTGYHGVLFKSTDAGMTWEGPIEVQLGGEYGLEPVKQFISDEALAFFFDPDPVPPRDEVDYGLGYEGDLSVDAWGNPHFIGTVIIADNAGGYIYPEEGYMAQFHFWSEDMGQTWQAFKLYDQKRWDVVFTDPTGSELDMFTRPQVATTQDGAIVFFSWLDTENPDLENNEQPDIFFREYFPTTGTHGDEVVNVTTFSAAMWNAFYGCMSHYVFSEVSGEQYTCNIPFVYEELTNFDPSQPVQFYYIPNFVRTYTITGIPEQEKPSSLQVSQNYPNPANTYTNISISTPNPVKLTLEIFNLAGARVYAEDLDNNHNPRIVKIPTNQLSPGIYFYRISSENESVTRKMMVSQ